MDDTLFTDEHKPKRNFKKFFMFIIIIILIALVIYGLYTFVENKKKEEEKKKKEEAEINLLNPELDGVKYFGIRDNYIVGINDNLESINIYNLLQGTGQFGDFKDYFYYDKNLYLIFSDNNIYKLSLTSGNKVYELTKYISLDSPSSFIGFATKSNVIVTESNNIDVVNKSSKGDIKTVIASFGAPITKAYLLNKALYLISNNTLYKYDLVNNTNTKLYDNVSNLSLYGDVLTFNISGVYYGYNTKTNAVAEVARDVKNVVINNNKIYSLTNDGVYDISNNNKKIYNVHYNNLDNINSIGSFIEVSDTDTVDETKKRTIYIDLKDNNKSSIGNNLYTNIKEYTK